MTTYDEDGNMSSTNSLMSPGMFLDTEKGTISYYDEDGWLAAVERWNPDTETFDRLYTRPF